jgi:hypothetical protein
MSEYAERNLPYFLHDVIEDRIASVDHSSAIAASDINKARACVSLRELYLEPYICVE